MEHTGNKKNLILPILILAVSVFLTTGVKVIFPACGMHDDGTYGSCHWAEQAVMAAGIIVAFQALMLVAGKAAAVQKALSFTVLVSAVVTAFLPGAWIRLCMMPSMACRASMAPWTWGCCACIAVLSLINLIINLRKKREER